MTRCVTEMFEQGLIRLAIWHAFSTYIKTVLM